MGLHPPHRGQAVALTGSTSIIDVQLGTLRNDYFNSAWGNNKAGVNVASGATFDIWDGAATADELNGDGTINKGWVGGGSTLTFGVNNGSGTFNGLITNTAGAMNLVKQGAGTQILTGGSQKAVVEPERKLQSACRHPEVPEKLRLLGLRIGSFFDRLACKEDDLSGFTQRS